MYKNIAPMFVRQSTYREINKLLPDPSFAGLGVKGEERKETKFIIENETGLNYLLCFCSSRWAWPLHRSSGVKSFSVSQAE